MLLVCLYSTQAFAQGLPDNGLNCSQRLPAADESYPFLRQTPLTESPDTVLNIQSIEISRLRIFDENNPEEDNWLFRWANRLHILTRENIIERLLLFEEG